MQLNDLINKTLELIKERGYKEGTWKHSFRNGRFSSIREHFERIGETEFSVNIAQQHISEIQARFMNGEFSYSRAAHLEKLTTWLIEVHETGALSYKANIRSKLRINAYFDGILDAFLSFINGKLSAGNVIGQKSIILHFLNYLQCDKRHENLSNLSLSDVQDFIVYMGNRHRTRLDHVNYSIKCFLKFLQETQIIQADLTPAVYLSAQRPRKVMGSFTHDEVERILAQPDLHTPTGKRNYAILLLGKNTGLRKSDILGIKLSDIDFERNIIQIIQQKTGRLLISPLDNETKEAINAYIKYGRPQSNEPYIFLRSYAPYTILSGQSATTMFKKYLLEAGIEYTPGKGRSFHGLRRSIARWMLDAEIPLTTISQVLGHQNLDSTVPYLSFDDKNLQQCSFSLCGIEVARDGLK